MSDENFTDRAREMAVVTRAIMAFGCLMLVGERRKGKTSVLKAVGRWRARHLVSGLEETSRTRSFESGSAWTPYPTA